MSFDLTDRASEVLGRIIDTYLEKGDPVGSRALTRVMSEDLSAATIRNVMQDLEYFGLVHSPHTSAGRVPTQAGLRLFVDSLLKIESNLPDQDRKKIEAEYLNPDLAINDVFEQAGQMLSGMSSYTGMVIVPKREAPLRDIRFVPMDEGKALAILVLNDGSVENRVVEIPENIPPGALEEASNFLQKNLSGLTIFEVVDKIKALSDMAKTQLDALTAKVVEAGVAIKPDQASDTLIVQGASNMLNPTVKLELDEIRRLFDILEQQETAGRILEQTIAGDGVQIFIGSENTTFQSDSVSMVVSACRDENQRIIGATGVIGPTHLNYRRIVPLVDYTAQMMSRILKSA